MWATYMVVGDKLHLMKSHTRYQSEEIAASKATSWTARYADDGFDPIVFVARPNSNPPQEAT
jgi:hypothetical protein